MYPKRACSLNKENKAGSIPAQPNRTWNNTGKSVQKLGRGVHAHHRCSPRLQRRLFSRYLICICLFSQDFYRAKEIGFSGCLEELHVKGKDRSLDNPCLLFIML